MLSLLSTIHQDPSYHLFADPGGSLLSNLAFALVGALGLRQWRALNPRRRLAFAGCLLVALGSAWYHANPSDASLLWDRLPMTLVFAAVFAEAVASFRSERLGQRLLLPLIAMGLASVCWWHVTGDLRPYAIVQFGPMLAIPILIDFRRPRSASPSPWWHMLALYTLAKLLEASDVSVFGLTGGLLGGHTLKHLAAAAALWAWNRTPGSEGQSKAAVDARGLV